MAYTIQQLTTFFSNANAGTAPTTAQILSLQGLVNQNAAGTLTDAQALQSTIDLASDNTVAVSVETYQFFTGTAPSEAGLAALNAAYVGSGAQAGLNGENRFIAQSIALALQNPTAKAAFSTSYGSLSVADATKAAYNVIIGNVTAAAAGINVDAAIASLTSATSIAYYTAFVKANVPGLSASDLDLAVKAALVGEIMFAATGYNNGAGIGSYATAANNLVKDLADDGHLAANNANGVDLFGSYGVSPAAKTYTLTTAADTITGGAGDDIINALTIDANGAAGTTFSAFDSIDGGAGNDTLNIYTNNSGSLNFAFPTTLTVKNVEIVNINNIGTAATNLIDASKYTGIQQLWQAGAASIATNAGAGVTIGFRNTAAGATLGDYQAAGVSSDKVALDNAGEGATIFIGNTTSGNGSTLANVTVSGTVADSNADGTVAATSVVIGAGKNVGTVTLNSAVKTTLFVNTHADTTTTQVTTVDASASTGAITYSAASTVGSVLTGSGADTVTLNTATVIDNPLTAADETFSASVSTGAGNDTINVNTSGTGKTSVLAGDGNDSITINSRGSDALTINAGAGNDTVTLTSSSSIGWVSNGVQDSVDGGDGVDTLAFSSAVGTAVSASTTFAKAFTNFEKISVGAVGNTENGTIDLGNLNNISYVKSAGSTAAPGVTETAVVTFQGLLSGQSVTVGDKTYTNTSGASMTASAVASAFAAAFDITGYTDPGTASGASVTFTSTTANTNVTDLTVSVANSTAPTAPAVATTTQGVTTVAGTAETSTLTFQALVNGESTTVAGKTVTATATNEVASVVTAALGVSSSATVNGVTVQTDGATTLTAQNVADILRGVIAPPAGVTVFGSPTGSYTITSGGANTLTYTSTAQTNVADLQGTGVTSVAVTTQGTNGNLTAAQVASVFAGGTVSGAAVTGSLTNWTAGAASGNQVTFTSTTAANVTDITSSSTAGVAPVVSTTQGVNPVAGVTEAGSVTFNALKDGQSATVDGITITANGQDLSASQVANAWFAGNGTGAIVSGFASGLWTYANADVTDAIVTFTSNSANTSVTDHTVGTTAAATAPTAPSVSITQGTVAYGNLSIVNMAANGTLELTGATAGTTTVALKDASGTSDVVNILINGASNITNTGSVVVNGVETINITTADTTTTADPAAASVIKLSADSATKIVVTGNHGVDFTGSTLSALTSLDASGVVSTNTTGAATAAAVTFTSTITGSSKSVSVVTGMGNDVITLAAGNTKGGTINAGAGDDIITGSGGVDTINAGSGNDVVKSSAGADVITLGDGKDTFQLLNAAHSTISASQTITDFTANTLAQSTSSKGADTNILVRTGDIIDVSTLLNHVGGASVAGTAGGAIAGISVGVFANAADAQTYIQTTFQNSANTAFALDSSTGKLYMDFNHDGNIDSVITLTGVTTLTSAAFLTGI